MAQPASVQNTYKGGMKRDGAREALPQGACWNLVDFIPETLGAVLRKRGGYEYASPAIPSGAGIIAGITAEYTAGQSVLGMDGFGNWYWIDSLSSITPIASTWGVATRSPIFYNDMVITPDQSGTYAPGKITRSGATHSDHTSLGGGAPTGRYGLIYKDVVWVGGSAAEPKRIWFSLPGQPESWDNTVKWVDMSYPITGFAGLSNAVLVFSLQRTARIRGSQPPPDDDFTVDDPVFEIGCTDNRSIQNYRDKVIFANAQGLYMTDGVALEDLTRVCGMKGWWRDIMKGREGFATGTQYGLDWRVCGGIYDDFYFYAVLRGDYLLADAGMIDLTRYNWTRLSNLDAMCFFDRLYPQELFFGTPNPRLEALSPIFVPDASNMHDADGTPVIPLLETAFFGAEPGMKTFQDVFVTYDMTSGGAPAPTLRVSATRDPEPTGYTDLVPDLPAGGHQRSHIPINRPGLGIAFKITQVGYSLDTRLHDIELAAMPREKSR